MALQEGSNPFELDRNDLSSQGWVESVVDFGHAAFLEQLMESIGIVINTIEANMRTEDLLTQSQSLAQELQSRQQELQRRRNRL